MGARRAVLNARLIRLALVAVVLGVSLANGWKLYRHARGGAQATAIVETQLQAPADRQSEARLRDSLLILQHADRALYVRVAIVELLVAGICLALWLRLGRVLRTDDRP